MKKKQIAFVWGILLNALFILTCSKPTSVFRSNWPEKTTRYWVRPEYWTNRLQDWMINEGRLECINGTKPLRTVHLLTHWLAARDGDLNMSVCTGILSAGNKINKDAWCGFLIGVGSLDLDYRARAIIHQASGENGGLAAGINGRGEIVFYDNTDALKPIPVSSLTGEPVGPQTGDEIHIQMSVKPVNGTYTITLSAYNKEKKLLTKASIENISADRLTGNLALVSNGAHDENGASFWFRDWKVSGSKVDENLDQAFGPVLCALHTLSDQTLKMTVQMPPMAQTDPQTVRFQVREYGTKKWNTIEEEKMVAPGWTVPFRVSDWDDAKDYNYRLVYSMPLKSGKMKNCYYEGSIRQNPREKDEIVVAAFTGNNNTLGSFGNNYSFTENRLWFPHKDLVDYVKVHKPDVLVYTGDNVYEWRPTEADRSGKFSSYLDYLYKWYMFCWAHGELAKNAVTVCMTDDHDVYHGNIWGDGGKKALQEPEYGIYPDHYKGGFESHWVQDQGGYRMPAEFVKMVERTQTSHLPDPYDPTPVEQGIGVYYTSMNYGGISFAVLEDRKFKSSPSLMVPKAKIVNGFSQIKNYDYKKLNVSGAKLLGDRQLKFLKDWAADWRDAWMKVALFQTIFANVSTYPKHFKTDAGTPELKPEPLGVIPKNYAVAQDMDSNGWPQTGRNKAIQELRRGFAFIIAGDQHLGSVIHNGIDTWDDAGYSFCVPSIANLWPRRWFPQKKGVNHKPGMPEYTGSYFDGFGNRMTVLAVSNPFITNQEPAELHDRVPGYGIVRLNKKEQKITMECWPRYSDPSKPDAEQYIGWPITISMEDNYGRKAKAYLPTLKFEGIENPVVQVIEEPEGDIVYTIRVKGNLFRPKVFEKKLYTVKVGEPGTDKMKILEHVLPIKKDEEKRVVVKF